MSLIFRPFLLVVVVFAGLVGIPRGTASASYSAGDGHVLGTASVRLGHQKMSRVLAWLRLQPSVVSALRGADGKTVEIRFRDGSRAAILPSTIGRVRVPLGLMRPRMQLLSRGHAPASTARAVVMEPFATELGIGPHAGDVEVNDLQSAGYSVDQLYDTQVSVNSLATLSQYNVVYMQTHAGVTSGGEGIVASGEPANNDPAVKPYIQNGTVIIIGVSGSSQPYYGITSSFITRYEGQFPANSIEFLNGCNLLASPRFWSALSAKGAGVLVSWNREATTSDNLIAGAKFFQYMDNPGTSVDAAIAAVHAAGFGVSHANGQVALLNYTGDGTITLQSAATAPANTPEPRTATPGPPQATAAPTDTGPAPTPLVLHPDVPTVAGFPAATATAVPAATDTVQATATQVTQPTATATQATQPMATARATATGTAVPAATQVATPGTQKTATAQPTTAGATATPSGNPPVVSLGLKQNVAPGSLEVVRLTSVANTVLHIRVTYPNGDHQSHSVTTNTAGKAVYRYKQGASKITHTNAKAVITIKTDDGTTTSKSYTILFNRVDVSVEPRVQSPGRTVKIWVHSASHMPVTTTLLFPNHTYVQRQVRTGAKGWTHFSYLVAKHKTVGRNHKVVVVGRTMAGNPHYSTKTTFTAK